MKKRLKPFDVLVCVKPFSVLGKPYELGEILLILNKNTGKAVDMTMSMHCMGDYSWGTIFGFERKNYKYFKKIGTLN